MFAGLHRQVHAREYLIGYHLVKYFEHFKPWGQLNVFFFGGGGNPKWRILQNRDFHKIFLWSENRSYSNIIILYTVQSAILC